MFSHIMVGSNDIARSKKFYDALFGAMGGKAGVEDARGRLIYAHNEAVLISSTDIRARVKAGQSIDGLVDPAVARYIDHNGLYKEAT